MEIINLITHLDENLLQQIITNFGWWTYIILFSVIFAETGLIIAPFLPGDSLLFIIGTLAGASYLNLLIVCLILITAAILGDTVNYWVGHYFGPRLFKKENSVFFNKNYLEKTQVFYKKHGGKTIIFARFLPIIRTFAPFVAGIGRMKYNLFILYNIIGGVLWVLFFTLTGYYFGSLPFIKNNIEYAIIAIIIISILPIFLKSFHKKTQN
jgi:membrane-associated protein